MRTVIKVYAHFYWIKWLGKIISNHWCINFYISSSFSLHFLSIFRSSCCSSARGSRNCWASCLEIREVEESKYFHSCGILNLLGNSRSLLLEIASFYVDKRSTTTPRAQFNDGGDVEVIGLLFSQKCEGLKFSFNSLLLS